MSVIDGFVCYIDVDGAGDPPSGDTGGGGTSAAVLDSWEDGASSTPEDGTAKPIVEGDNDVDMDTDVDGDEEKPKPVPKKVVEQSEPKQKKEHINIVIIGHVGKIRSFSIRPILKRSEPPSYSNLYKPINLSKVNSCSLFVMKYSWVI